MTSQRSTAKRKAGRRPETEMVEAWAIVRCGRLSLRAAGEYCVFDTRREARLCRNANERVVRVEIREIGRGR